MKYPTPAPEGDLKVKNNRRGAETQRNKKLIYRSLRLCISGESPHPRPFPKQGRGKFSASLRLCGYFYLA